jgi:hypothetical protein
MSGEPEPTAGGEKLSGALVGLTFVWLGLVLGLVIMTVVMAVAAVMMGEPILDMPELAYGALLLVPLGLVGAFVVAPMATPTDPEKAGRVLKDARGVNTWAGTPPDDPYYWFPVYAAGFFIRAAMLEGSAITLVVFFLLTANWVVLGGVAVLAAALITQRPTRAKYDTWLEEVRQRQAGELG